MARANRHFVSGYAWHITHRCHKKEFLFKLVKDRERFLYWLFQAIETKGQVNNACFHPENRRRDVTPLKDG